MGLIGHFRAAAPLRLTSPTTPCTHPSRCACIQALASAPPPSDAGWFAHRIVNPRRLADQTHGSRLRLVLPLELHRLEARCMRQLGNGRTTVVEVDLIFHMPSSFTMTSVNLNWSFPALGPCGASALLNM